MIGASLLLATAACKQGSSDQSQGSAQPKAVDTQKNAEEAYKNAADKTKEARSKTEEARKSEQEAQKKQQEASQAQQKAQQAGQQATQAQQAQQEQQPENAQQPESQGAQAREPQTQPRTRNEPQGGAAMSAQGTVQRATPDEVVIQRSGQADLHVKIDPQQTTVLSNGQTASPSQIQQGANVSVQYRMQNDQAVAQRVEITPQSQQQPSQGTQPTTP